MSFENQQKYLQSIYAYSSKGSNSLYYKNTRIPGVGVYITGTRTNDDLFDISSKN